MKIWEVNDKLDKITEELEGLVMELDEEWNTYKENNKEKVFAIERFAKMIDTLNNFKLDIENAKQTMDCYCWNLEEFKD